MQTKQFHVIPNTRTVPMSSYSVPDLSSPQRVDEFILQLLWNISSWNCHTTFWNSGIRPLASPDPSQLFWSLALGLIFALNLRRLRPRFCPNFWRFEPSLQTSPLINSRNVDIVLAYYTDPLVDLVFNIFFDFVSPGKSYPGPDHTAVIMNNLTQLECKTGSMWQFTSVDLQTDNTIFHERELQKNKDRNHTHYQLNQNGQYDLIINSTKLEDAGVYTCFVPGNDYNNDYRAQLIVLGKYKTMNIKELLDHYCLIFLTFSIFPIFCHPLFYSL